MNGAALEREPMIGAAGIHQLDTCVGIDIDTADAAHRDAGPRAAIGHEPPAALEQPVVPERLAVHLWRPGDRLHGPSAAHQAPPKPDRHANQHGRRDRERGTERTDAAIRVCDPRRQREPGCRCSRCGRVPERAQERLETLDLGIRWPAAVPEVVVALVVCHGSSFSRSIFMPR